MVVIETSGIGTWSREPVLIEKVVPYLALCTSCCVQQEQQSFITQFRVIKPYCNFMVRGRKRKHFLDKSCSRYAISAIFDLQATLILSTMFRINWNFHSGEEVQIRFSKDGHLGFWNNFVSTSHHSTSYQVSSQLAFWFKPDFQDGGHGSYFGFCIRTIFTIFYLQVALIFPTKF